MSCLFLKHDPFPAQCRAHARYLICLLRSNGLSLGDMEHEYISGGKNFGSLIFTFIPRRKDNAIGLNSGATVILLSYFFQHVSLV